MNIILAHDSFTQLGGAEKVVDVFHELFPRSPVYALVMDKKLAARYQGWDVQTSWLQNIYNLYPHFQRLLPLVPWAVDSLVIRGGYNDKRNVLLSSSSGFIKGSANRPIVFT